MRDAFPHCPTEIFSIKANLLTVVTSGIITTESFDKPESFLGTTTFGVYPDKSILLVSGITVQVEILLSLKSSFCTTTAGRR